MAKKAIPSSQVANWLGDSEVEPMTKELTKTLDALYTQGPDEKAIQRAQAKLKGALDEVLPPVVYYDMLPATFVGDIWVAVGDKGLVAVNFGMSERAFVRYVERYSGGRMVRSGAETAEVIEQLADYMAGKRDKFDMDVDLHWLTDFQRRVLDTTAKIPHGRVSTYGEIARRIGNPRSYRAVGQALRNNPAPIVIPCHRVIASDGTLGGYGGQMGSPNKVKLLRLEGVMLA